MKKTALMNAVFFFDLAPIRKVSRKGAKAQSFVVLCSFAPLREIVRLYLRITLGFQAVKHPRERDRFADVFDAAHPRRAALDAHSEAGVRNRAETPQIEIPFE
jgi:hypothetical protein